MSAETGSRRGAWIWVAAAVLLAAVFVLLWGLNMRRGLNHDEHQFVGSAALIARNGLLPYRDFPYFHVPALSFIYALLFQYTDYLLLAARSFSVLCSWLTLALIFGMALLWPRTLSLGARIGLGAATVVLLMTTPSFMHASGRAWNHDFPILLTLAAACTYIAWLKRAGGMVGNSAGDLSGDSTGGPALWWLAAPGILVGLAAAARLTFVLAGLAFVLSILLVLSWRSRRAYLAISWFAVGMVVGALPALYMLWVAPAQFVFGNFTYAQLNTAYYQQAAEEGATAGLLAKLAKTFELIVLQPGNLLLILLTVFGLWRARASLRRGPDLIFLLLLLASFLAGAYAPTPMQQQYIYPLFPLLALIFLAALAYDPKPRLSVMAMAGAALVSALLAAPRYVEGLEVAFVPDEWYPLKVHARGEYLGDLVGQRDVLTLAPIFALEGGATIYPEFVTGPLAWRVAPLLSADERRQAGVVSLDELDADLSVRAPRGIFTGVHDDDLAKEEPLLAYAQAHGYVPIVLPDEGTLWASPIAVWEDRIRLGAVELPKTAVQPGDQILATLHIQAMQPITLNLNVLIRLVNLSGQEAARSEGWPWGRATSTWQPGEVWPDGHTLALAPDAAPGPYRVEVSFYDPGTLELLGSPATVGHVVIADPQAPDLPTTPPAQFGDGIALAGAQVPQEGWLAGATQTVDLTWLAETAKRGRYTVFLHFIGPNGTPAAQGDQEPWQGVYPTDAWLPGVPARDRYQLTLPEDLPAGDYSLVVGLYDPATQQRLPLFRNGSAVGDSYQLAAIQVP